MPLLFSGRKDSGNLPVTVRVSPRARRVALRLDPASRAVHLIVPRRMSLARAMDFARRHEAWIHKSLAALPETVPFCDGQILPVLGQMRRIGVSCDSGLKSTNIALKENEIIVRTNLEDVQARIRRFLVRLAREHLEILSQEKALSSGKKIKKLSVRDTRSRWGSCSPDGAISFSWRLIFAPPEAMDYVVAHEVAHLVHMNHGKAFWALCESLSTDFSAGRRWMRLHGQELMRYG